MSPSFAELQGLRIGCVQYLNAKPLIWTYPGEITFEHPSRLAEMLARGELDVALVPTFEALRSRDFLIVDGASIASRGSVYSVFLAYRGCLKGVKSIALDPASLTSVHLLRVLLAEFHGLQPDYLSGGAAEAQLLIGNQAIAFRQKHGADFHYLDLGEEWLRCTGLPFVFAVWLVRSEVQHVQVVAENLRALKCDGMKRIGEIAQSQRNFTPDFAKTYLTEHIRFELGAEEKMGMKKFCELLMRHGFISQASNCELRFV